MTNQEAIISVIQVTGYTDGAIDKALEDVGLNVGATYNTKFNKRLVDLAAIEVLKGMLAVDTISEGSMYSIKYSLAGVKLRLDYLTAQYRINTLRPRLSFISRW